MTKVNISNSSIRLTVLSIGEYSHLNNSGRVRLASGRSRKLSKNYEIKPSIFNSIFSKAPDVGLSPDFYVLVIYECNNDENFLDIRNIKSFWAINEYAAQLLDIPTYEYCNCSKLWNDYLHNQRNEQQKFNGWFLVDVFYPDKSKDIFFLEHLSLDDNIGLNVKCLTSQEASLLNTSMMTYAFGWKAALTILRRLAVEHGGDNWKDRYWKAPSISNELEIIRKTKFEGCILSDIVYNKLIELDRSLWNIPGFPQIPLPYLAVLFHYCGFAVNDKEFSIKDFKSDLEIINQKYDIRWAYAILYLLGQCLNGKSLMKIYKMLVGNKHSIPIRGKLPA